METVRFLGKRVLGLLGGPVGEIAFNQRSYMAERLRNATSADRSALSGSWFGDCKSYHTLSGKAALDWGVCGNPRAIVQGCLRSSTRVVRNSSRSDRAARSTATERFRAPVWPKSAYGLRSYSTPKGLRKRYLRLRVYFPSSSFARRV
jgi:hypothetical protein